MSTKRIRQHILPKDWNEKPKGGPVAFDVPGDDPVKALHEHFQVALEIEHATIPPYLCALYSLKDGANAEAAQIIKSVVIEEMLHMTLVSNILNAIGGSPNTHHPKFVPEYPTYLPYSDNSFIINLEKFSKPAIDTFRRIELPQKYKEMDISFAISPYHTIGEFYLELKLELEAVASQHDIFTGDYSRQITPEHYYGSGGVAIPVTDLKSAVEALEEIVGQGEGIDNTIMDGDDEFGQIDELSHYFRFDEIAKERKYIATDSPKSGPTGAKLKIDWDNVYPMQINPKMAKHPEGSEVRHKMLEFNQTYMKLLKNIDTAMNGQPQTLMGAVVGMYDLKYQAIELMKVPSGDGKTTAGPSFEYVPTL